MRMSDSPTVTVETTIGAAAADVYTIVTDLDAMAGFGVELTGGKWKTGRLGELGSTFSGTNRRGDLEWETLSTVVEAKPGEAFAWVVGDDAEFPLATWRFELQTVAHGTDVQFTATMGPGESGLTRAIAANPGSESDIIDKRLLHHQDNMVKTLEGIRRRLERR